MQNNFNPGMNMMGYMNPWQQMLGNTMQQLMQAQQQQQPMQQPQQQQPTTPPMIHADMIGVADIDAMKNYPVNVGVTQGFFTFDEKALGFKTMHQDGTFDLDIYMKQPPAPAPQYMTREEVEEMVRKMTGNGQSVWMNEEEK